jgi:hypothetical protein
MSDIDNLDDISDQCGSGGNVGTRDKRGSKRGTLTAHHFTNRWSIKLITSRRNRKTRPITLASVSEPKSPGQE